MIDFIFDVESAGLHGEGFAVAWLIARDGVEFQSGGAGAPLKDAKGTAEGVAWCQDNLPESVLLGDGEGRTPYDVRKEFWRVLRVTLENVGLVRIWADVAWPVEARFLIKCVEDMRRGAERGQSLGVTSREWEGPFPLLDIETLVAEVGIEKPEREGDAHDPLADVRHSLKRLNAARAKLAKE